MQEKRHVWGDLRRVTISEKYYEDKGRVDEELKSNRISDLTCLNIKFLITVSHAFILGPGFWSFRMPSADTASSRLILFTLTKVGLPTLSLQNSSYLTLSIGPASFCQNPNYLRGHWFCP
jgi:hypothetical protein